MSGIDLFVVGFGRPDLLREQKRLLDKYLLDGFALHLLDNTPDPEYARGMMETCHDLDVTYLRVQSDTHEHPEALNVAARIASGDYWGCLDHDVFPTAPTSLIDKIDVAGFLGLGQTYSPRHGTPLRYLWPGWVFFSRSWLNGRVPNFNGIRGEHRFDDGDCGSELHMLFADGDLERMAPVTHGYGVLRPDDGHGLQSYGYEVFGANGEWIHFTNASNWKAVPDAHVRDHLVREMVAAL